MQKQIKELYELYIKHPVISTDSRDIPPRCLFFALKGDHFNGNDFAESALDRGAALAVVDDYKFKGKANYWLVNDVLETLAYLAAYHRAKLKATIIAVTGTNGKTTTKELIRSVLNERYKVQATKGNFNNHIGVPLTLLKMPMDLDFGIVEMGANHPGEITALCEIAQPDFGLITNVGKAHLEGFGSLQGVLKTKAELYTYLKKSKGKVFINAGNKMLWDQARGLEAITYGKNNSVFCKAHIHHEFPKLTIEIDFDKQPLLANSNLFGTYNFENILSAACIGKYFDVEPASIIKGIEAYVPDNLRSQFIQTKENSILLDAYNANPTSMQLALGNFARFDADNKVLILGEMAELGNESKREHESLIKSIVELNFPEVWLIGKQFKNINKTIMHHFQSTDALINALKTNPLSGKTIFVKGSRSNQLERILPYL